MTEGHRDKGFPPAAQAATAASSARRYRSMKGCGPSAPATPSAVGRSAASCPSRPPASGSHHRDRKAEGRGDGRGLGFEGEDTHTRTPHSPPEGWVGGRALVTARSPSRQEGGKAWRVASASLPSLSVSGRGRFRMRGALTCVSRRALLASGLPGPVTRRHGPSASVLHHIARPARVGGGALVTPDLLGKRPASRKLRKERGRATFFEQSSVEDMV